MKIPERQVVTLGLIGINVFIFFLEFISPIENYFSFVPAYAFSQPWTFVTAMFLHVDFIHIFFNMFALFIFGTYLEARISKKYFLIIYFASGIIGNVGYMITAPGPLNPGLGASGAISGIMGALAMISPSAVIYFYGVPMPMIIASFFWLISEYLGIFGPSNIAHGAHLGGLLLGIILGLYLRTKYKKMKYINLSFLNNI